MEDAHAFVYDFGNIPGQGYFAIFDGHAGKHAAEWCGQHFHEVRSFLHPCRRHAGADQAIHQFLLKELDTEPDTSVPDVFNSTFHRVDAELSAMASAANTHSGCTAVTAFLRIEKASPQTTQSEDIAALSHQAAPSSSSSSSSNNDLSHHSAKASPTSPDLKDRRRSSDSKREKFKSFITGRSHKSRNSATAAVSSSSTANRDAQRAALSGKEAALARNGLRRVLYTANVGDARAVLWCVDWADCWWKQERRLTWVFQPEWQGRQIDL